MTHFHFTVDTDKCIKCQRCIKVCSSACLIQDTNGYPMRNRKQTAFPDGMDVIAASTV